MTAAYLDIDNEYDVLVWRFEQLVEAGYDRHAASELAARRDVDLHEAEELLEHGCSVATALEILR